MVLSRREFLAVATILPSLFGTYRAEPLYKSRDFYTEVEALHRLCLYKGYTGAEYYKQLVLRWPKSDDVPDGYLPDGWWTIYNHDIGCWGRAYAALEASRRLGSIYVLSGDPIVEGQENNKEFIEFGYYAQSKFNSDFGEILSKKEGEISDEVLHTLKEFEQTGKFNPTIYLR